MRLFEALIPAIAVACLAASPPAAATEVRLGAAVTGMELWAGVFPQTSSFDAGNLDSVQGQIFFALPDETVFRWLLSPRLEFGGLLNLRGRESYVFGGLNWQVPIFDTPAFLEVGVGAGVHNGAALGAVAPMRNLGCPFGIHYSYGVGAHVAENLTVSARFQHLSHAYLCSGPNEGLNSVSVSLGHSF